MLSADALHVMLNLLEKGGLLFDKLYRLVHQAVNGPKAILPTPIQPRQLRNLNDIVCTMLAEGKEKLLAELAPLLHEGRLDAEFLNSFLEFTGLCSSVFYLAVHPPPALDGISAFVSLLLVIGQIPLPS